MQNSQFFPNSLRPKILLDPKLIFHPIFWTQNFFWPKNIFDPKFSFDPKFFNPISFRIPNFLDQIFLGPNLFDLQFLDQNIIELFLWTKKGFAPNIFGPKIWTQTFLTKNLVWQENLYDLNFCFDPKFLRPKVYGHDIF